MNKTKEQKYNDMFDRICKPEIARLKKIEAVAVEILKRLNNIVNIDYCGLDECHLINTIQRAISESE
jgi:hypothetical protein